MITTGGQETEVKYGRGVYRIVTVIRIYKGIMWNNIEVVPSV